MNNEFENINKELIFKLREAGRYLHPRPGDKNRQKEVLVLLEKTGPITQRDLTRELKVTPPSASELLSKLEYADLITRRPSERDRRNMNIELTDLGIKVAREYSKEAGSKEDELFEVLTPEEKDELLCLLNELIGYWETILEPEPRPPKRPPVPPKHRPPHEMRGLGPHPLGGLHPEPIVGEPDRPHPPVPPEEFGKPHPEPPIGEVELLRPEPPVEGHVRPNPDIAPHEPGLIPPYLQELFDEFCSVIENSFEIKPPEPDIDLESELEPEGPAESEIEDIPSEPENDSEE